MLAHKIVDELTVSLVTLPWVQTPETCKEIGSAILQLEEAWRSKQKKGSKPKTKTYIWWHSTIYNNGPTWHTVWASESLKSGAYCNKGYRGLSEAERYHIFSLVFITDASFAYRLYQSSLCLRSYIEELLCSGEMALIDFMFHRQKSQLFAAVLKSVNDTCKQAIIARCHELEEGKRPKQVEKVDQRSSAELVENNSPKRHKTRESGHQIAQECLDECPYEIEVHDKEEHELESHGIGVHEVDAHELKEHEVGAHGIEANELRAYELRSDVELSLWWFTVYLKWLRGEQGKQLAKQIYREKNLATYVKDLNPNLSAALLVVVVYRFLLNDEEDFLQSYINSIDHSAVIGGVLIILREYPHFWLNRDIQGSLHEDEISLLKKCCNEKVKQLSVRLDELTRGFSSCAEEGSPISGTADSPTAADLSVAEYFDSDIAASPLALEELFPSVAEYFDSDFAASPPTSGEFYAPVAGCLDFCTEADSPTVSEGWHLAAVASTSMLQESCRDDEKTDSYKRVYSATSLCLFGRSGESDKENANQCFPTYSTQSHPLVVKDLNIPGWRKP